MKILNSNIEKLETINDQEWDLLQSLRLQISFNRYKRKIIGYCNGNGDILNRVNEILSIAESSVTNGVIVGTNKKADTSFEVVSLVGLNFQLAFEVIDKLSDELSLQSKATSNENITFKDIFKTDSIYATIIKELSQENPTKWFDGYGSWDYKGKRNAHPSAACELLTYLGDMQCINQEYEKALKDKKQKANLIKLLFGVVVGSKSRTLTQRENIYRDLSTRFKSILKAAS